MQYLLRVLDHQPDEPIDIHNISEGVWNGLMTGACEIFLEGDSMPTIATGNYWLWKLQHDFRKLATDESEVLELRDLDGVFEEAKILLDDESLTACLQVLLDSLDKFERWENFRETMREKIAQLATFDGLYLKPPHPVPAVSTQCLNLIARGIPLSRDQYYELSEYFGGRARYRAYQEHGWEDLKDLNGIYPGDIMRSKLNFRPAIVSAHYGSRITLVSTQDVTNPGEWQVRRKEATKPAASVDKDFACVTRLSMLICDDDPKEKLRELRSADPLTDVNEIVMLWEPVEDKYSTVEQLLNAIE